MTKAKWHIIPSSGVRKCKAKKDVCRYGFLEEHFLDRQKAVDSFKLQEQMKAEKEKKRKDNLPEYVKDFFDISLPPKLPKKQEKELRSLRLFLEGRDIIDVKFIRFGDDGAYEPDFVINSNGLIGIEITEIHGSKNSAIAYNKGEPFDPATKEEWLKAIEESYRKKLSNRKDGTPRYDKSKFEKIILLMDDKSGRDLSIKFEKDERGNIKFLENGTPITNATLFQQLFEPYSEIIDESYLVGLSSSNNLGNILIKGHLNV